MVCKLCMPVGLALPKEERINKRKTLPVVPTASLKKQYFYDWYTVNIFEEPFTLIKFDLDPSG